MDKNENNSPLDSDLIDKGFCLIYWQLSYRRRLIRDMWVLGISIVSISIFTVFYPTAKYMFFFIPIFGPPQWIYNYIKWKKTEGTKFLGGKTEKPQETEKKKLIIQALKWEFIFYLLTGSTIIFLGWLSSQLYFAYFSNMIAAYPKESTIAVYLDHKWVILFCHSIIFSTPVFPLMYKYIKKLIGQELYKKIEKASEDFYGISAKGSFKVITFVSIILSLIGLGVCAYSYKSYSIFTADKIIVSTLRPYAVSTYMYTDIKTIYKVKFFKAPNGRRVYRPHYAFEFIDGRRWLSRKEFSTDKSWKEEVLLSYVLDNTKLKVVETRYLNLPK